MTLHEKDLPETTKCPICGEIAKSPNAKPNNEYISAAQYFETSVEMYDSRIIQYNCVMGHVFYVSVEFEEE